MTTIRQAIVLASLLATTFLTSSCSANTGFYDTDKWFSNPVAGMCRAVVEPAGNITLEQKGALTHKNKWVINKIGFDISFEPKAEIDNHYLFLMQFAKFQRQTFFGETHNRGTQGYSYALGVSAGGEVSLLSIGVNNSVDVLHKAGKVDISKSTRIELKADYSDDYTFTITVDGKPSSKTITPKLPEYAAEGFITLIHTPISGYTYLTNIELDGREVPYSSPEEVNDVYFLEYFKRDVNRFLHWRYNQRTQDYAGVNIYCEGKLIESLKYPAKRFAIPFAFGSDELVVKAFNIDGKEAAGVAKKLVCDEHLLVAEDVERIIVLPQSPQAQLVGADSGEMFEVRGVNYVRLCFGDHSNFIAATDYLPNSYNRYDTEAMFRLMKRYNYNTVRVFLTGRAVLNPGIGGYPDFNEPVYKPYLDNLVDFLRLAKKYGVYVLPTFGDGELPLNRYYMPYIEKMVERTGEQGQRTSGVPYNSVYLSPEGIEARSILVGETIRYIKEQDPTLLKAILAVQCQNELNLKATQWPFSKKSGKVRTANGKVYDMADNDSRQKCMDEGLNYYHRAMIDVIKGVDPELLVAEGSFTLRIVGKDPIKTKGLQYTGTGDERFPPTATVMGQSGLDIIDIHIYHVSKDQEPADSYRKDMESMEFYSDKFNRFRTQIPVILGEFGAFRFIVEDLEQAKRNIIETRDISIEEGLNGYMIWTLDTFEQQEMHNALDGGLEFLAEFNDNYRAK